MKSQMVWIKSIIHNEIDDLLISGEKKPYFMLFDAGFLKLVHQGEPPEPTPRAKANLAFSSEMENIFD